MGNNDSVLSAKFNLVCERGHFWFSPQPFEWVGSECATKTKGKASCKKPLVFIRNSREFKPKVKKKKSKLAKIKRF